ncbi:MAG TPA: NosD domain-containing protein [Methanolinea sp.]|nr:NosD domain-containing protein [Methanolinea sp.]HQK55536.1 NosD domain-containing protein [Methanolinea sp.]
MKVASSVTKDSGVRLFFLIGIVTTVIISMPAMADTWTVCHSGCNFTTIQDAISAASDGDTIQVMAGEYHELVAVNKAVTLQGEDANTTVINGDHSGNVLTVVADGVVVKNIQLKGSIRKDVYDETWPGYGIGVLDVSGVTIDSCIVTDNQVGIYGDATSGLVVSRNDISGNDVQGILLDETTSSTCTANTVYDNGFGIMAFRSKMNFFCLDNQIIHNRNTGLGFVDGLENALIDGNLVQDNTYEDFESIGDYNRAGGYFESLDNVMILNNRFLHNGGVGLFLDGMSQSRLNGNILEGNYAGFSYHDGNPAPGNTVTLSNTVDGLPILYLENVCDRDIPGSGYATIYIVGCQNVTVHDANITTRNGFGILARGGEQIGIRDNSVANSMFQNILVSRVQDAEVLRNRVGGGAMIGAGVYASTSVSVTGNHATGNKGGLGAAGICEDVWFADNILEENREGLSFEFLIESRNISVMANRITGNNPDFPQDVGILIINSEGIKALNNKISGVYEGVFLFGGRENIFEQNTLDDCDYGFEISPFAGTGGFNPACFNRVIQNVVSAREIAFFTTDDVEKVYSNYIFLNNFTSESEPPDGGEFVPPDKEDYTFSHHPPLEWGLPRSSDTLVSRSNGILHDAGENIFHTDTPVIYEYGGRTFKGFLGNHWNWYEGTDTDGNGVGKNPYSVIVNNTDKYPLLSQVSAYHPNPSPLFYADFEASPVSGASPLSVQFTDHSVGNPTRYLYRFGDGFTSMSRNPIYTYRRPGNYTVSLTIWKMDGKSMVNATTFRAGYITVEKKTEPVVVSDFTATPVSGTAPLQVAFTGTSTGTPILWKYSFGDGFMSTQQNPTHTYRRPGSYTVKLTVWTIGPDRRLATETIEKGDYITVT